MARPGHGRPLRRKLAAAALALFAALAAGEVLVRATLGAPLRERLPILEIEAHARRGWAMLPHQEHYTYQHLARTNSLGLRGPEPGPRQGGRPRVLALGDSLVYGQGVAEEDTLPAALQAALRRGDPAGREWEVVNGGHRAYDTGQELALLEELGPVLRPDVVVLFWYWNDLRATDVGAVRERLARSGPVAFDTRTRMEGRSLLVWRLRQAARASALGMLAWDVLGPRKPGDEASDAALAEGLERLGGQLDRLLELCGELGALPLLCVVPDRRALLGEHPSTPLAARALELAAERGIETIDLSPPLQALAREAGALPVLPFDGHYRPDANHAMAELVARRLLQP